MPMLSLIARIAALAVLATALSVSNAAAFEDDDGDCVHSTTIAGDATLSETFGEIYDDARCRSQRSSLERLQGKFFSQFYNLSIGQGDEIAISTGGALDTVLYLRAGHDTKRGRVVARNNDYHGDGLDYYYNSRIYVSTPGDYTLEVTTTERWDCCGSHSSGYNGARYTLIFDWPGTQEPEPEEEPRSLSNGGCAYDRPASERTEDNKPAGWDRDNPGCPWDGSLFRNPQPSADCVDYWAGGHDTGRWASGELRPAGCSSPIGMSIPAVRHAFHPGGTPRTYTHNTDTAGVKAQIEAAIARYSNDGQPMTDQAVRMLNTVLRYIESGSGKTAIYVCEHYARFGEYLQEWDLQQDRIGWADLAAAVIHARDNGLPEPAVPHNDFVPDTENWYPWCDAIPLN